VNDFIGWDKSDVVWAVNILRRHGRTDWRIRIVDRITVRPQYKQDDATGHYTGYCRREERVIEILRDQSRVEFRDTFVHELAHTSTEPGHGEDWRITYETLLGMYMPKQAKPWAARMFC
jgi:hypothetical protein